MVNPGRAGWELFNTHTLFICGPQIMADRNAYAWNNMRKVK